MYERIVIIGQAGSGKSTLARTLGPLLKIKVIHLDRKFWSSNWQEKPREDRIEIMQGLVQKRRWIIEGSYLNSSDSRLNAADTIIFLDMPFYFCFWWVIMRCLQYKKEPRPDLPQGCPEKLSLRYILKVLVFPLRGRRLLHKKLAEISQCEANNPALPKKNIHIFTSRKEVDAFLCQVLNRQQAVHTQKESRFIQKTALTLAKV